MQFVTGLVLVATEIFEVLCLLGHLAKMLKKYFLSHRVYKTNV